MGPNLGVIQEGNTFLLEWLGRVFFSPDPFHRKLEMFQDSQKKEVSCGKQGM